MHVLLTANTSWNIWNFRRAVVSALARDGHRISVHAPPDDCVAKLREMGCTPLALDMNQKGMNPFEGLQLVGQFKRIFRAERPDVVLSYTIKNNIFGAMAARACGVPFIPCVTGLGTAFLSGGVVETVAEVLYRRAFRNLATVFFQNEDDKDLFLQRRLVSAAQAEVLPGSGIDLVRFAAAKMPPAGNPPAFLMVARLMRDKGIMEFIGAARNLKRERPDLRFQLLGATGSENRSAIDAETVGAWVKEGVIEYLGTTDDVRPFIASATCLVLPSYREGAPRTLIEAAAMARPVIATDVPGCRSVVEHGRTGLLCAAQSVDSLTDAIRQFLSIGPDAHVAMGLAGRVKMEREYDEEIVVSAYKRAIVQVTGGLPTTA